MPIIYPGTPRSEHQRVRLTIPLGLGTMVHPPPRHLDRTRRTNPALPPHTFTSVTDQFHQATARTLNVSFYLSLPLGLTLQHIARSIRLIGL